MKEVFSLCNIYQQTRPQGCDTCPHPEQAAALPDRGINRRNATGDPWLQQEDQKHIIQQMRHSFITCHNLLMCPEDASSMIPSQKQPFPFPKPKHTHQSLLFIFCLLLILILLAISKTRLSEDSQEVFPSYSGNINRAGTSTSPEGRAVE